MVAEARRALTTLSLFGYRVDGVVANRIFPADGADDWRRRWVEEQAKVLSEVEHSFSGLPIWRSPYLAAEPTGVTALAALAECAYGGADAFAQPTGDGHMAITRTTSGATLRIALPFVAKSEIDLARHGDELVVTVGAYRRLLALPAALSRHTVEGARIEDGCLQVRFRADQGSA